MSRAGMDYAAAALALALGGYALIETREMSTLGAVFPVAAGVVCVAGALALAVSGARRPAAAAGAEPTEWGRFAGIALVLLAWAVALKPLGFIASSALGMAAVAALTLRERPAPRALGLHLLAGAALLGAFVLLLRDVLRVPLP